MEKHGFYIIKESFFEYVQDPNLKGNKGGNRPHYYCFLDNSTGLYWMIPLSSRIEKYRKIIKKRVDANKSCDTIHILKTDNGKENAFLIQDMFPITEDYIEREYTIAGNHMKVTSEHSAKELDRKARKVLGMIKRGIRFLPTQPNALKIQELLLNKENI